MSVELKDFDLHISDITDVALTRHANMYIERWWVGMK